MKDYYYFRNIGRTEFFLGGGRNLGYGERKQTFGETTLIQDRPRGDMRNNYFTKIRPVEVDQKMERYYGVLVIKRNLLF